MRSMRFAGIALCLLVVTPVWAAAQSPSPEPGADAEAERVIELTTGLALGYSQGDAAVFEMAVQPGETILFRITNTAPFAHNFYIGTDEELTAPGAATADGVPAWSRGLRELEWTVPDDVSALRFGCTVTGHYPLMSGSFSVAAPGTTGAPSSPDAMAALVASASPPP